MIAFMMVYPNTNTQTTSTQSVAYPKLRISTCPQVKLTMHPKLNIIQCSMCVHGTDNWFYTSFAYNELNKKKWRINQGSKGIDIDSVRDNAFFGSRLTTRKSASIMLIIECEKESQPRAKSNSKAHFHIMNTHDKKHVTGSKSTPRLHDCNTLLLHIKHATSLYL
jgi:hypothetical protein